MRSPMDPMLADPAWERRHALRSPPWEAPVVGGNKEGVNGPPNAQGTSDSINGNLASGHTCV